MTDIIDERDFAHVGGKTATLRAEDVLASAGISPDSTRRCPMSSTPRTCRSSARRTG